MHKKNKSSDGKVRLQKFLSEQGVASRRKAEEMIADGEVKVNGQVVELGCKINPDQDAVFVNGKRVQNVTRRTVTIAMNKPKGYLCSNEDPHHDQTVFDLLPALYANERLFCAGRLDKDSEGLLILTNDGDLCNRLIHPSSNVTKRYRVKLNRELDHKRIPLLLKGITVEGEFLQADKIIPATEGPEFEKRLEVHLHHGRKREIRRLLEAVGYHVKKLKRYQIGNFILKGMGPGEFKVLSEREIRLLFG